MTLFHALALALLLQAPPDLEQIVRERAAAHNVSGSYLVAVVDCETGGTWDPTLIGKQGERGPLQLHPQGELIEFYRRGYDDPEDWWSASDFAAARMSEGAAGQWSCPR